MSLKTWSDEFYPVNPSKRMTKKQAIEHSLRKWTGLLPKNLEKHGVTAEWDLYSEVYETSTQLLENVLISSESCALCVKYDIDSCRYCPLYKSLGKVRCDEIGKYPYRIWRTKGDPCPMIKALKALLEEK